MIHKRLTGPGPAAEPLSLAEVKDQLRVTEGDEDGFIERLIADVRDLAERLTGRALAPSTWLCALDAFPCDDGGRIRLPAPPVLEVVSATYVDPDGATQPLSPSAWLLDDISEPAWLFPAYATSWPSTRAQPNAVRITVRCGLAEGELPESLRRWMLLHIAHYFENREASTERRLIELPYARDLIAPHCITVF